MRPVHLSLVGVASVALLTPLAWSSPGRAAEADPVAEAPAGPAPTASTAPSTGQATGFYLTGAVGAAWPSSRNGSDPSYAPGEIYTDNFTGGFSGEVGVGYDFGAVRTELTYTYDGATLQSYTDATGTIPYTSGQQGTNSILLSAYWDINTHSRWTPYLGAGIGYGWQNQSNASDASLNYIGYSASAFAWQAKAGISYSLTPKGDLFAEFVYRGLAGYTLTDPSGSYHYDSFNRFGVQIGTRWRF